MKEFENWFDKSGEDAIDLYENHYSTTKELMEDAWKAALAWAQKMMNENILNEALPEDPQ